MSELHKKLGELLAMERTRQGKTLEEFAADLKITEANLGLLEAGEPDGLPSPLYFDLFAKSYAQALGIDYDATVAAIKDELRESSEAMEDEPGRKPAQSGTKQASPDSPAAGQEQGKPFKRIAYILGGAVVILVAFLIVNQLFLADSGNSVGGGLFRGSYSDDRASEVTGAERFEEYKWNSPPKGPDSMTLVLTVRGDSWVAVLADGDTAVFRVLTAGQTRLVSAQYRMQISVGIPSQVDVELNGQIVDLRNANGRIYEVEVTQLNLPDILAGIPAWQVSTSAVTRPPEPEQGQNTSPSTGGGGADTPRQQPTAVEHITPPTEGAKSPNAQPDTSGEAITEEG